MENKKEKELLTVADKQELWELTRPVLYAVAAFTLIGGIACAVGGFGDYSAKPAPAATRPYATTRPYNLNPPLAEQNPTRISTKGLDTNKLD